MRNLRIRQEVASKWLSRVVMHDASSDTVVRIDQRPSEKLKAGPFLCCQLIDILRRYLRVICSELHVLNGVFRGDLCSLAVTA